MAYNVPVLNISVKMWRLPNAPPAAATSTFNAQLYITSRPNFPLTPGSNTQFIPPIYLRCSKAQDVKPGDVIEAAAGDGWYYRVRWVDRMHRGFVNEYKACLLEQGSNLTPPAPGAFPPPPPPAPAGGGPYYGYSAGSSAGSAVNFLNLGGGALSAGADRAYLAVLAVSSLAPIVSVTCNAVAATNIGGGAAVGPYFGEVGDLRIWEANPGAGPVAWQAQCSGISTAYLSLIGVNLTNPGAGNVGPNTVSGISPAVPTILTSAPVAAVPTPVICALGMVQGVGNVETFTAPFLDVGAQVAQAFAGVQSTLNVGVYANPPLGTVTANASTPTTAGSWGMAIFGKH